MEKDINKDAMLKDIASQLNLFGKGRGNLIPILQMIHERHAFLHPDAIKMVGEFLEMAECEVYGVATFYNQFRFHPPGKHPIKVCLGTACHVRGSDIILENFERKLEIKDGQTTPDNRFTLESVRCIGCCSLGPVVKINEDMHGRISSDKIGGVLDQYE